jgi:transposase InsO family protein
MGWKNDLMSQRLEFLSLALAPGANFSGVCRRFGISRKTGYKWAARFAQHGRVGLADRSRRPSRSHNKTCPECEEQIEQVRRVHPSWGPRKLRRFIQRQGRVDLPAVSTFGRILRRRGLVDTLKSGAHQPWIRFERAAPNQLWQMDFKGHFALQRGGRCHPLNVLDDCSRYVLGLEACADQRCGTVQQRLQQLFERHGLPEQILCDNGAPWSGGGCRFTELSVWLLRLGVGVIHGRCYHPQTQGKDERFHRTLKADLLSRHDWRDLAQAQARFEQYRHLYNHERPHEALALDVPASRYQPSLRNLPECLPEIGYEPGAIVRRVKSKGEITFLNRFFYIGEAFHGFCLALRPTATESVYRVCFGALTLGSIDLETPNDRPKGHYFPMLTHQPNL